MNLSLMSPRKKESVISRSPLIDCLRGTSAIAAYVTLFKDVTVSMVVHLAFSLKNLIKYDIGISFIEMFFRTTFRTSMWNFRR